MSIPRRSVVSCCRALVALAVGLGFSGCAHVYNVRVEALRNPEPAPRHTYRLVNHEDGAMATATGYAEAEAMVQRALASRGLHPTSRPEWADLAITIEYDVGPRRLKAAPEVGGEYAGAVAVFRPNPDAGPLSEATGAYVPAAALKRIVAVSEKKLTVVARENTMGQNTSSDVGAELWRVEVTIEDGSSSIESLMPILVAAVIEHIDAEAATSRVVHLSEAAPEVRLISQSL